MPIYGTSIVIRIPHHIACVTTQYVTISYVNSVVYTYNKTSPRMRNSNTVYSANYNNSIYPHHIWARVTSHVWS